MGVDDDDNLDGRLAPAFGVQSAIEERKLEHEQDLQKYAFELFGELDIYPRIISAVDKGLELVDIQFPEHLVHRNRSVWIGNISYRDVWSCFGNLMRIEYIEFQFKYRDSQCCSSPVKWERSYCSKGMMDWGICRHCDEVLIYESWEEHWHPTDRPAYICCEDVSGLYGWPISQMGSLEFPDSYVRGIPDEKIVKSNMGVCENCKRNFSVNSDREIWGIEIQIL